MLGGTRRTALERDSECPGPYPDAVEVPRRSLLRERSMKFFFADSFDVVDPSFDFDLESRSRERVRHRSDAYAHELFTARAYDGLLVSKGIVDTGRYSIAQRHRLLRIGGKEFFRARAVGWGELPIMGDCGAFTYVREDNPPVTVDDVLHFYSD